MVVKIMVENLEHRQNRLTIQEVFVLYENFKSRHHFLELYFLKIALVPNDLPITFHRHNLSVLNVFTFFCLEQSYDLHNLKIVCT